MDSQELAFIVMHARAVTAEGTLEFLVKKLSELTSGASPGQIAELRSRLVHALEEIAQHVERDVLAARKRPEEERNLIADEFRATLESLKQTIAL